MNKIDVPFNYRPNLTYFFRNDRNRWQLEYDLPAVAKIRMILTLPKDTSARSVKKIADEKFDLILMDCNMPEMSGYDATIEIRKVDEARAKNVPIIALTANAMPEDKDYCMKIGMNGYISKPFKIPELLAEISSWIELSPPAPPSA